MRKKAPSFKLGINDARTASKTGKKASSNSWHTDISIPGEAYSKSYTLSAHRMSMNGKYDKSTTYIFSSHQL